MKSSPNPKMNQQVRSSFSSRVGDNKPLSFARLVVEPEGRVVCVLNCLVALPADDFGSDEEDNDFGEEEEEDGGSDYEEKRGKKVKKAKPEKPSKRGPKRKRAAGEKQSRLKIQSRMIVVGHSRCS